MDTLAFFLFIFVPFLRFLKAALNLQVTFLHAMAVFGKRWFSGLPEQLGFFVAHGYELR